jgi:SAM-dependent methyltransferase
MAATCPIHLDVGALRDRIRAVYTRVADDPTGDFHFHRGPRYAVEVLAYDAAELETLPPRATARFAGVGNPLAIGPVVAGQTVLDHACGAGMDLLLAARRVGPAGKAIGVDMTPRMRESARMSADEAGVSDRVEILDGMFEELPVATASVDVVLSNGVLNLAPDKRRVLREVRRVLRPGGALYLADVVVQRELTLRARSEPELWAACIGGALMESELHSLAAEAGLVDTTIHGRFLSFAGTSAEAKVAKDLQLSAVHFSARARS